VTEQYTPPSSSLCHGHARASALTSAKEAITAMEDLDRADNAVTMVRQGQRFSGGRCAEAERRATADGATIERTYRLPGYCRRR
jgi:hypothetical protein